MCAFRWTTHSCPFCLEHMSKYGYSKRRRWYTDKHGSPKSTPARGVRRCESKQYDESISCFQLILPVYPYLSSMNCSDVTRLLKSRPGPEGLICDVVVVRLR